MYVNTLLRVLPSRTTILMRGIRGGGMRKELAFNAQKDDADNDWEIFDKAKEAEYEAIQQIENPRKTPKDLLAEEHRRKKVMRKIIEKRHFKTPQEVNLLTWDAKEQIRYLHNEFPDEWTIDRLVESFPISREGVIKLLRSKFVPDSVDRIIQHDKQVQERWLQIRSGKLESGGPLALRYQHLLDEGKLHTLAHAAGHTALPSPNVTAQLSSGHVTTDSGTFHAIVKDYCERKRQQNQDDMEAQLKIAAGQNRELLADITKALKVSKSLNKEVMSSFAYTDKNVVEQEDAIVKEAPKTLLDKSDTQKTLGKVNSLKKKSMVPEVKKLETRPSVTETDDQGDVELYTRLKNDEHVLGTDMDYIKKKNLILKEMKYERPSKKEGSVKAYRFDPALGYQHPLGRVVDEPSRVHISKSLQRKDRDILYKKGDSFYDETGDLIFRVPGMSDKQ